MAPITLTRSEFSKRKPGGDYSKYLSYVNAHRSAKLGQANQDPLAATPQQTIDATVKRFTGMYGAPMNEAGIATAAKSELDPIIAAVTSDINSRAKTSSDAIAANAAGVAKELGGIDFGAPYTGAKTEQAAVDAALRDSLAAGGGTGVADDLRTRLAQINDPAVEAAAGGLADRGAALGGTEVARGSANLGSLIASGAAAKEYGLKMPGIARLSGLQDVAGVNRQAVSDIGDKTAQLEQQLPSLIQGLRDYAQGIRSARAQAAVQIYETLTGQNITKATAKAGLQNTSFDNGLAYANTFGTDPVTGQPVKGYHVDPKTGNVVKNATPKQPKKLTTSDRGSLSTLAHKLYNGVAPHFHPVEIKDPKTGQTTTRWDPVPGTGAPPVTWEQAVQQLIAAGAPDPATAVQILTAQGWKPGEGGRPYTKAQQGALKAAAAAASHAGAAATAGLGF